MSKPDFAVWLDFNGVLVKHARGAPVWSPEGEVLIGPPVRDMVARVRRHMAKGRKFVLKSAMMADPDPKRRAKVEKALGDWAEKHLGQRLEVTATCRPEFLETWCDKSRQVVRNEGRFVDEPVGDDDDEGRRRRDGQVTAGVPARGGAPARMARGERRDGAARGRAAEEWGEYGTWDDEG